MSALMSIGKSAMYASYEESFRDYAQLMKDNPRYANVVTAASSVQGGAQGGAQGSAQASAQVFAQGLQRAGYATDPADADKLTRVITPPLRLQRAAVFSIAPTAPTAPTVPAILQNLA